MPARTVRGTVGGTARRANPAFAVGVVLVSLLAIGVVTLLSVQGFGFLMPGEVWTYLEMTSEAPDPGVISAIGQQNARLSGVQGLLQLVLIGVMGLLRYGGF